MELALHRNNYWEQAKQDFYYTWNSQSKEILVASQAQTIS